MFDNVAKFMRYPDKTYYLQRVVLRNLYSKLQLWANGERYGESMIQDFNNGTVGWTDWNVLLDQNGGPNHVGNFCFHHFMEIQEQEL
jgi:glucosylceramidase